MASKESVTKAEIEVTCWFETMCVTSKGTEAADSSMETEMTNENTSEDTCK